ncbi:MAG: class I SAM-dependent DNA methyltransferase, partial [Flavobacteriales bacterium]|nr:class I SAM-dependent DNA methyltransferase [Flavobacteriales bacterium]
MRDALGDGYTDAIRKAYRNVPDSADFVMFWWDKAAELVREGKVKRFGFITTNSLRQTFNRKVVQHHLGQKKALSLAFAIPDHPWVDSADGAAVRVSMTVGVDGSQPGFLCRVIRESEVEGDDAATIEVDVSSGKLFADLTIGADVASASGLLANSEISNRGVQLIGSGFIVSPEKAKDLGLGRLEGAEQCIRVYRNGRDITGTPREVMVIDLFGLTAEEARLNYPEVYQHVFEHVKPERDQNNRASYRNNWWIHGEPRKDLRAALVGLPRYIATVETSKHRFFVFLDKSILPDNKLVNIALEDAYFLGVLSSKFHTAWALAAGGFLGVGNDPVYTKTRCFETFPFPAATEAQQARIRELGEQLDAHRKRQQAQHPEL